MGSTDMFVMLQIHGLGIIVFAIGVGVVNDKELYAIASSRDYMFKVANYSALDTLKGAIAAEACKGRYIMD